MIETSDDMDKVIVTPQFEELESYNAALEQSKAA